MERYADIDKIAAKSEITIIFLSGRIGSPYNSEIIE
jgi:hypothetical protein